MGIKYFFKWLKENNKQCIQSLKKRRIGDNYPAIDVLLVDMNCIIHYSAQKVYGHEKLVSSYKNPTDKDIYYDVCLTLRHIVERFRPSSELMLAIDGVCPTAKQVRQRQRRFYSVNNNFKDKVFSFLEEEKKFDSDCISPGTKFMDSLSRYIHKFIVREQEMSSLWRSLKIIFSNDKVHGEGEHKLLTYLKGRPKSEPRKISFHSSDSDLVMLGLSALYNGYGSDIYLIREYPHDNGIYQLIDCKKIIEANLRFPVRNSIPDYILMWFFVGNDFLPNIPNIDISTEGISLMIDIYNRLRIPLTSFLKGKIRINYDNLFIFLKEVTEYEKVKFEEKLNSRKFFRDKLMESCCENTCSEDEFLIKRNSLEDHLELDIELYRIKYKEFYFSEKDKASDLYLAGLQWVLSYYIDSEIISAWYYPYRKAPMASDLIKTLSHIKYTENKDFDEPFLHLLNILPPQSASLLPYPLNELLEKELSIFVPKEIKIEFSGLEHVSEAKIILPTLNKAYIESIFRKIISKITKEEAAIRNIVGKNFLYVYGQEIRTFA